MEHLLKLQTHLPHIYVSIYTIYIHMLKPMFDGEISFFLVWILSKKSARNPLVESVGMAISKLMG